jgi:MoxR-like ATPase
MTDDQRDIAPQIERVRANFQAVQAEMSKVIVGQEDAMERLLVSVLAGGHVLLTGMPGLGRTLLVKTLATVLGLSYNRIQFTPDLLPSDILGAEVLESVHNGRHFRFFKGPVFCNLLLADEVNRSPARTQAALLEAMHERQVTAGGQTYWLPQPFIVVATRNSIETDGVWRMPEAQLDRFLAAIELGYLGEDDEVELLRRTTGGLRIEVRKVLEPQDILEMQNIATAVPVTPAIKHFALEIVRASRPELSAKDSAADDETQAGATAGLLDMLRPSVRGSAGPAADIRLGASPRAAQAILRGAKVLAIVRGRCHVSCEDVVTMAYPVMEHRLMLDLRATSRGLLPRHVVDTLVQAARRHRLPAEVYRGGLNNILRKPNYAN